MENRETGGLVMAESAWGGVVDEQLGGVRRRGLTDKGSRAFLYRRVPLRCISMFIALSHV